MKLKRRSNGIWELDRRAEGLGRVSTGKRDKAEALLEAQRIMSGKSRANDPELYTVSEALDDVWEDQWKDDKSADKKKYEVETVRRRWGDDAVGAVTYGRGLEWIRDMRKGRTKEGKTVRPLTPKTINKLVSVLSVALTHAGNIGKLDRVPKLPRLPARSKRVRWVSAEEERKLKEEAQKLNEFEVRPQGGGVMRYPGTGDVLVRLITVLIHTGCRLSEILKSRPDDVQSPDGKYFALILNDTKSSRPRGIPLTPEGHAGLLYLFEHVTWQAVTDGIFREDGTLNAKRLASARDWCIKRFTYARNAAKLPGVSLHVLRHTCATRLVQAGVDIYQVMHILGHSSINVTKRYAHLNVEHLRDSVMVLSGGTSKAPPADAGKVVNINERRKSA